MMAAPISSSQDAGVRSPIQFSSGLQIVSYALFSLRNCRGPVSAEPADPSACFQQLPVGSLAFSSAALF